MSVGPVVLIGSGETAPSGSKTFRWLFDRMPTPVRVAVLETPAGFEPNSTAVAEEVATFLRARLPEFRPVVTLVAARRRGTPDSPDDPTVVAPLLHADVIYAGAGSPTYAVRQLRDSLAWDTVRARHRLGAALALASAATLAIGRHTVPVYEIFKVGDDLHWLPGLDLFGGFGLDLTFVPHWDNTDGGEGLDTRRCYLGVERFTALCALLPTATTIVGLHEHSALAVDLASGRAHVFGQRGVTLVRCGEETTWPSGTSLPIAELGTLRPPDVGEGIPTAVWSDAVASAAGRAPDGGPADDPVSSPPGEVLALARRRAAARGVRDWAEADRLRERLAGLGWLVHDTPDGPEIVPADSAG